MPHLEVVELVLFHYNIINNIYQRVSRILHAFVPNKPFGSLLEISPTKNIFLKRYNLKQYHLIQNFKKSKYGLQIKLVSH